MHIGTITALRECRKYLTRKQTAILFSCSESLVSYYANDRYHESRRRLKREKDNGVFICETCKEPIKDHARCLTCGILLHMDNPEYKCENPYCKRQHGIQVGNYCLECYQQVEFDQ